MSSVVKPWKAYAALLIVYLVWGTTLGFIRIGVNTLPWALLPCIRFLTAGLLLTGFSLLHGERLPQAAEMKKHAIAGGLLFFAGNSMVCWAVKHISTGLGGLMVATTPFWMVWLSSVLPPRERVSPMAMIGISIGFIGMMILLSPQWMQPSHSSLLFWLSVLVAILNTFFWSLGSIYVRKNPTPASLLMTVGLQNLFGGLLLLPVCAWTIPDWRAVHWSASAIVAILYLILMGTVLAMPCYLYVLRQMPVSVSSTFAYVTPVITVFFGWLFLREGLTPLTLVGMVVILIGVIVVQWVNQYQAQIRLAESRPQSSSALLQEASES
jgi:drug/metabolite transporter (DMT)-like permease